VIRPHTNAKGYANGQVLTRIDGELRPGYNIRTFQQPDVRAIYFLLPGSGEGVLLKGIEERRAPESVSGNPKDASR
jgi:hypothetical protein